MEDMYISSDLAFDFNTYVCKTCLSIGYEMNKDGDLEIWTPKKNSHTEKFLLGDLSVNLLQRIIVKMDQNSFVRMRRTNKQMSNFIKKYRDAIRLSLFHTCRISFNPSKDEDDAEVSFICPPPEIYEEGDSFKLEYESLEGFQKRDFGQFTGMVKKEIREEGDDDRYKMWGLPMITISLKQWKNCPDLQRELMGVYHAATMFIAGFQTVTAIELVCEFINFAGLKGKKLEAQRISDECLRILCEKAAPIGLADIFSRHNKEIFMQNGFQTLKELILMEYPVVPKFSQLSNLEKIQIRVGRWNLRDNTGESYGEIFKCVNKWRIGEMALKELVFYGYNTTINVADFNGTIPSPHKLYEILEQFGFETPATPEEDSFCTMSARPTPKCSIKTSGGMYVAVESYFPERVGASVLRCETRDETAIIISGECNIGPRYIIYFKEI